MVSIHEKIVAQLEHRKLKKRDLARALSVSPQTATDICKGRSAITLPHLRNLVAYFSLRADFWLDDTKLLPEPSDRVAAGAVPSTPTIPGNGHVPDPGRLMQRLRTLVAEHKKDFTARNPDLTEAERQLLGLEEGPGAIGRIGEAAS
ncbi:MAG: helix-turn-helix domain-containing protein [Planctomycetota bacterium]